MNKTTIAIHGAAGRMGQRLIALGHEDPTLTIACAIDAADHPQIGTDAGLLAGIGELGVPLGTNIATTVSAIIDFSTPAATDKIIDQAQEHQVPLVVATTGLGESTIEKLTQLATQQPVVWAPSMSLAVNVAMKLAAAAGEALRAVSSGVDVEIVETHHRFKADAPSGTALKFGEIIADVMDMPHEQHGREGQTGARPQNEIGYHAIRSGDNPGEHRIVFGMLGESIELTVKASNRDCYALGALSAAKFVCQQSPGLYSMNDVIWPNSREQNCGEV
jgi:4-hydroxy-tetrahydrodipicolinate reductase